MKILAIDSSTKVMGVAVAEDGRLLAEYITNTKLNHAVRLMPAIEQVLGEVGIQPNELDRIVVSQGPGSYTGVRIGVTLAKTMAWSLNKELVGVSTLACMAQNGAYFQGLIVPFFDARRDRVYTGLYKNDGLEAIKPDQILPVEKWLERLQSREEPILFLGQDLDSFRSRIQNKLGSRAVFAPMSLNLPRPSELAKLGECLTPVESIHHFVPDYLQMAEAEAKWLEAQERKLK